MPRGHFLQNRTGLRNFGQANPKVIAVSGPVGSTGKTTVAISLALELAATKASVLLIDADVIGGSIVNHFLLSEFPAGFPAALRIASQKRIDTQQIERLSVAIPKTSLRIMPAGKVPGQPVFDPETLALLIAVAKDSFDYTVIDLPSLGGGSSWQPETEGKGRDLASEVFSLSDRSIVVCLADPIGIFRLLSQQENIRQIPGKQTLVMNRVRNSVIAQARSEISITLQRLSEFTVSAFLPDDPTQIDQALKLGVPALWLSRSGSFRQALTGFVRAEILQTQDKLDSRMAKLG